MSWSSGAEIYLDIWSTLRDKIDNEGMRKSVAKDLLLVFISNDIDPYHIEGCDDELDEILREVYS